MVFLIFLMVLFLYILQQQLYQHFWERNLNITVEFKDGYIIEGEDTIIQETVINEKWLPLPFLQVAFDMSRNLEFHDMENANISDKCYKRDIFSVLYYQKIVRELKLKGKKRGYYQIDQIDLVVHDIFQNKCIGKRDQHTSIYVYPKPVDLRSIEIPYRKAMGMLISRKQWYEDPFEFRGIRDYQSTDAMNMINWKASARTGSLMVNLNESTTSQKVRLFLDIEDRGIMKQEELNEAGIRIAASLAMKLLSEGVTISVISNGKDEMTKKEIAIHDLTGISQMNIVNQSLARIQLNYNAESLTSCISNGTAGEREDSLNILISKNQRQELYQEFELLSKNNSGAMWIVPLYADMELAFKGSSGFQVIGWEVENTYGQ